MRAAVIRAHGGPEVLEVAELPDPLPRAREVRVRVRACALNHLDIWVREGWEGAEPELPARARQRRGRCGRHAGRGGR